MERSPFQYDPYLVNAGCPDISPMLYEGSPYHSSAYLVSADSEDCKTRDADHKGAVTTIAFCLLAVLVIGLGAFIAIQMSRNDDGSSADHDVGSVKRHGEGGKEDSSGGGSDNIHPGRSDDKLTTPGGGTSVPTRKPPAVLNKTTRCPRPWVRSSTTRREDQTTKGTATPEATTEATRPPDTREGDRLAAESINASIDWAYKPCDDFYSFVCRRFEGGKDAFKKLQNYTDRAIKDELLATDAPFKGQSATQKAALMFQACVHLGSNASNTQVESLKFFLKSFDLDISDMPSDPNFDIADVITQLSFVYGLPTYVESRVHRSVQNRAELYIHMEIHALDEAWILANYYSNNRDLVRVAQHYEGYIRSYDTNLDASALATRIARGENVLRQTIEFVRRHWRPAISTTVRGLGNWTRNYVSSDRWVWIIALYSGQTFNASSRLVLGDDAPAIVVVLMDSSRLALDDSRLLLAWSLLHRLLHLANGQQLIREAAKPGVQTLDAVTDYCYKKVTSIMAMAVTKQYMSKHVPPSALASGKQILDDVLGVLVDKLKNTPWFKDPVKNVSLLKMNHLRLTFGYPKELSNVSVVEALFADFPDVGSHFLPAYLESLRVLTSRAVRGNSTENFNPAYIDAEYQIPHNSITFTAGMLLPPLFILGAAAAMNYGGFGQIAGHEMMHAYDVRGIKFTYEGRPANYKVNDTLEEYARKVLCLRASYQKAESCSRARTIDPHIDSEGFADFTGILLSHEAFRRLPDDRRTRTVPDVGLTAHQVFFVAHCLKWCGADKVNRTREPGGAYWHLRSRCIVPLQNMPEFARAFSCRRGDYMNPEDRCYFW